MSAGIGIPQRIIGHITIPIQVLRVGIPWHNSIGTDEVVNIRRILRLYRRKKVVVEMSINFCQNPNDPSTYSYDAVAIRPIYSLGCSDLSFALYFLINISLNITVVYI